jgi:hypothetical protein
MTVKQWWKIDAALRAEWWQADREEQQRVRAALDAHAEFYPASDPSFGRRIKLDPAA